MTTDQVELLEKEEVPSATRPSIPTSRGGWVTTAAVFAGLIIILEVVLTLVEPRLPAPLSWPTEKMQAKYDQISAMADDGQEAEMVFVGSSTIFDGINPSIISEAAPGITAYNAGLTGAMSPRSWRWWTNEVVVPLLNPQTVVIGVSPVDLNSGIPDPFWNLLTSSPGFDQVRGNLSSQAEQLATDSSVLFRLRTVIRQPVQMALALAGQSDQNREIGPSGIDFRTGDQDGYKFTAERALQLQWEQLRDYQPHGEDLVELESLVADLESEGLEVVLVNMPITDDLVELLPDGEEDYAEYVAAVEDLAGGLGVRYLDVGRVFSSLDLFKDPGHVSYEGADRLSELLAEALVTDRGGQ